MKSTSNKRKTTTVSCDLQSREFIAAEAKRTGRLQREILSEMIKVYRIQQQKSDAENKYQDLRKLNALDLFREIKDTLDKNIKRDDQTIAFIKTQESKILSPMERKLDDCVSLLNTLVVLLKSFQSK